MIEFLQFAFTGRLFIFFARKFPPLRDTMGKREFSKELFECDLCIGFWTYLVLAPFFKIKIRDNKIINNTVLAMLTSFIVFLISEGWRANFETVVINASKD